MTTNAPISFEFFPTKTEAGHEKLLATAQTLAAAGPEFFSVTYGAGGSTRDGTRRTVLQLDGEVKVPTAPHLSCVGDSREDLRSLINDYRANGIQRIVALRGRGRWARRQAGARAMGGRAGGQRVGAVAGGQGAHMAESCEKSRTRWRQKGSSWMSHAGLSIRSKTRHWPHASAHFECIVFTLVTPSQ